MDGKNDKEIIDSYMRGDQLRSAQELARLDEIMKLQYDPRYIAKSYKSICKRCEHMIQWKKDHYECRLANQNVPFDVEYRREGVFHSQIIKCEKFQKKFSETLFFLKIMGQYLLYEIIFEKLQIERGNYLANRDLIKRVNKLKHKYDIYVDWVKFDERN